MDPDQLATQFSKIGFEDPKIQEILKNKKVSLSLSTLISKASTPTEWTHQTRSLLHNLASLIRGTELPHSELIVNGIVNGDLKTALQVKAAYTYLRNHPDDATQEQMNLESGVVSRSLRTASAIPLFSIWMIIRKDC